MAAKGRGETLEHVFNGAIAAVPAMLLQEFFRRKIEQEKLAVPDGFLEALVDHVLSGSAEVFCFDDVVDDDVSREVPITEADLAELEQLLEQFRGPALAELVQEVVHKTAVSLTRSLKRTWSEQRSWQHEAHAGFAERLEARWGGALDLLRMLLEICRDVGLDAHARFSRSKAKSNRHLRSVLIRLHARACQVTAEILVLMENGFADGAMARWRTLYEIMVVADFIAKHGDSVAERYLIHEAIESRKAADMYHSVHKDLGYRPLSKRAANRVQRLASIAIQQFGPEFGTAYGWASPYVGNSSPTFAQIEAAVGLSKMRSHFKMASQSVHAGVKGISSSLGAMGSGTVVAGASNAGLSEPGQNAALSLVRVTLTLLNNRKPFEQALVLAVLRDLQEQALTEFSRADRKLKRDSAST